MLRSTSLLALLFMTACGPTASTLDEPLAVTEDALAVSSVCSSFDQDAARGVAGAAPAPMPAGSSACATFTVSCGPVPGGGGAAFGPSTCTLYFTPDTCLRLGLHAGMTISDPHGLKVVLEGRREPANAWEICSAVHEVTHGEDNQSGGWERMCTTEINAFRESAACLRRFWDQFCADCRSPSYAGAATCASIAANARTHEAGGALNVCLCAGPATDATCEACTKACKAGGTPPATCDQLAKLYCD